MTRVAIEIPPDIFLGSEDIVLKTLLCKWIYHDFSWKFLLKRLFLFGCQRSDVVSLLFEYVDDDVDVTSGTPLKIILGELYAHSLVENMWSRFFFDEVEI